jgi:hypothetical protein
MLQIFHLFETYVAEGLHVATYVHNKQSGRGWLAGTRRASTSASRTTTCVGAPACGGMCAGAAVACGAAVVCEDGCASAAVTCGAGLVACVTGETDATGMADEGIRTGLASGCPGPSHAGEIIAALGHLEDAEMVVHRFTDSVDTAVRPDLRHGAFLSSDSTPPAYPR